MGLKNSVVEHITQVHCNCRDDNKNMWDCYVTEKKITTTERVYGSPDMRFSGNARLKLTNVLKEIEVANGITKNDALSQFRDGYDLQLILECDGVTDTISKF